MAAEPKRPPPPKSYVPLLLLDDGPTPELPPRPVIDDGCGGSGVPSQPTPQPRTSSSPSPGPAVDPVDLLLMNDNEPSLLISTAPLDPTPALLPSSEGGHIKAKPAPAAPQDGLVRDREDSTSPVPVKPERHKKKKGPPPVPAPYAGPKKISNEAPPSSSSSSSSEPHASGPTAAARRHTMAGTKPTRPRPPAPISPQAHESHEVPSATSSSTSSSRTKAPPAPAPAPATKQTAAPKQTPTTSPSSSIIAPNEQKAVYASVKKPKRFPPPTMPAPPPPYEGDTVKRMASVESPTTPNPPTSITMVKEPSTTAVMKESGQGHPPATRSQPPLLEETDGSGKSAKVTSKEGSGAAATAPGRPRPPRPAPSRPSRPPAVSPSPAPESPSPVTPPTKPQQQSAGVTNSPPQPSRRQTTSKPKSGGKPEITVVSAQPMVGDSIPPPSPDVVAAAHQKHDHHPIPQARTHPPPHPVSPPGSASGSGPTPGPARPPPLSAPRRPQPRRPGPPPPTTTTTTTTTTTAAAAVGTVTSPVSPTSPPAASGETGRPPQPKKRKEQQDTSPPPPPVASEVKKVSEEEAEQKKSEVKEEVDSAEGGPVRKPQPAPGPPRQPAKRPPPPRKLPEKKPPIATAQSPNVATDQQSGVEDKSSPPPTSSPATTVVVPAAATTEAVVSPKASAMPAGPTTAVSKPAQRPSRPPQMKRPPPLPQSKPAAESPDIAKKLQEIGPPPDEEPPEIPTEELMEIEAAAGGENQSTEDKGSPEPMEVSETVPTPTPSKPERRTKQPPPTPVERTAPETAAKENTTGKGEKEDGHAPKSTTKAAAPKRPPTIRRPPPPSSKRAHTVDAKPDDAKAPVAEPPVAEEVEKANEKESPEGKEEEKEVREKQSQQPPKRPSTVKRPPPPTARPVPRQREKSLEAQEQILSPKEEEAPLQSPTSREGEGGEKMENGQAESRPAPMKRLPSVSRPPPPSKRPHPHSAPSPATETNKEENIEGQVVDSPHENEAKQEEPAVTSPKQDKPPSSHSSPGPKRPQPPAIKKRKVTESEETGDVKEEEVEQSQSPSPPPPQPVQPQPATKKLSIKRPPPPAMPKKQLQPPKPTSQAVEAEPALESDKVEEAVSKEPTKDEKMEENSKVVSDSKEQEVSEEKPAHHSPGPKRPAPPINKRLSVNKPPPKPTPPQEVEPAENESREEEATCTTEKEHGTEDKSTESQVNPAADSKQETKELEVVEKKPTGQHSPGPKRPAPPSTKKLSIKKPPPPATARKPSIKAKQPPPAFVKEDEKTEGEAATKVVTKVEEHVPPNKPSEEQSVDNVKEVKPVIVESSSEKDKKVEEVSTAESSRSSNSESPEKVTMTVLVQPGRKSPNAGRRSPNMGRKSPILRKKLRQEEDSDEEELEGSVKIIKYPSGSSLTKNTNGKAGEAEEVKLRSKPPKTKPSRPVSMPPARPSGSPSLKKSSKQPSASQISEEKAGVRPSKPPAPSSRPTAPSKPPAPSKPSTGPTKPASGPSRPPVAAQRAAPSKRQEPSGPPPFPPRPGPGHPLYRYTCTEPHGIANSHYDATAEDELSFGEGDVIELLDKVDDHWFYARNTDLDMHEGLILASNLNIVKRLPGQDKVAGFEEGPCAVAMHDFNAQSMDELSLKAGDLIMLKSRVGSDWLRGRTINGQEGIFPKSFVEVVEDLPPDAMDESPPVAPAQAQHTSSQSTSDIREPHCVALYDFSAEGPGEMSIRTGDVIMLVEKVDADWFKGRLRGQEGIFPSGFVEIKVELPPKGKTASSAPVPPPSTQTGSAGGTSGGALSTALYDFDGQEGELSFKTGDKVKVVSRVDADWVVGELRGKKGMFPSSFVDKVPENLPPQESSDKEKPQSPSKSPPPSQPAAATKKETGKCEATFDFDGDEGAGELRFTTGEQIETTEWVNDEWMSGRIGSREGIFPVVFVKVIKELPKQSSTTTTASTAKKTTQLSDDLLPKAVALYDFTAGNDEEISFKEGDTLNLLERVGDSWFMGENTRTGAIGNFPVNFVNVVTPLP